MKKFLKMTFIIIGSLILFIGLIGFLFISLSPQFGASKKQILTEQVKTSKNHNGGVFHNDEETVVMMEFKWSSLKEYFSKEGKAPKGPIPVNKLGNNHFDNTDTNQTKFTWFGHSAILLEIAGKKIFIDPMLGKSPAPHPWLGPKRYNPQLPMRADSLPYLDAVLISHDHYDHLDYSSIKKLKEKTGLFIVPLGVGAHLRSWDIQDERIVELDWWESAQLEDIKIVAAPARHFSGRGLNDRNTTLWCSFVINSPQSNLYFSGDGGYGKHFREIGDKYGPFDHTFLECGQYNVQWAQIHMMPEELILANDDLRGKQILPIHWGAFTLALHPWTEPVDRLMAKADETEADIVTPEIGETIILGEYYESKPWWNSFK